MASPFLNLGSQALHCNAYTMISMTDHSLVGGQNQSLSTQYLLCPWRGASGWRPSHMGRPSYTPVGRWGIKTRLLLQPGTAWRSSDAKVLLTQKVALPCSTKVLLGNPRPGVECIPPLSRPLIQNNVFRCQTLLRHHTKGFSLSVRSCSGLTASGEPRGFPAS